MDVQNAQSHALTYNHTMQPTYAHACAQTQAHARTHARTHNTL